MIFTKLGLFIAWLAFCFGVLRVGMGFLGAVGADDGYAFAQRYLATNTTGEAINQGTYMVIFAVVLGILIEISKSLAARPKGPT